MIASPTPEQVRRVFAAARALIRAGKAVQAAAVFADACSLVEEKIRNLGEFLQAAGEFVPRPPLASPPPPPG